MNTGDSMTPIDLLSSRFSISEFLGTTTHFFFTMKSPWQRSLPTWGGCLSSICPPSEHLPHRPCVRMDGATPGSPYPPARLRAPRHRHDDRRDGAAARITKMSARRCRHEPHARADTFISRPWGCDASGRASPRASLGDCSPDCRVRLCPSHEHAAPGIKHAQISHKAYEGITPKYTSHINQHELHISIK